MIKRKLEIKNKFELRARQASLFVNTANKFFSEIFIQMGSINVSGKSILGIMVLGIHTGSSITISIDGIDEQEAMEELTKFIGVNTNYKLANDNLGCNKDC
ncbi:MAG: HPr family phosphocarrier protein [Rickettsiales bacterium]|jgi:phosphotransferase system HPr (HPr) family protein|nr:HPr family phosphocarrier protein [Rickettsiales bacterium]